MPTPSYRSAVVFLMSIALLLAANALPVAALEPLDDRSLAATLDALIDNHPTARRTTVALKVVDPATGEVLYDRHGDRLLTPASNLKIYTSAAALDLLGPDDTGATTSIEIDRDERTLRLVGGGAPMISSDDLRGWARQAADWLPVLPGGASWRVVTAVPEEWAGLPDKGPGWMWDDEPDYYNMTITPLAVDFNTLKVTVAAGDAGTTATLVPASAYPEIVDTVEALAPGGGNPVRSVRVDRDPFTDTVLVSGRLTRGAKPIEGVITMHDPDLWVAGVFAEMLRERGVPVGEISTAVHAEAAPSAMTFASDPLREAVKHFNKVSENAVGEMLLLRLGQEHGDHERFGPDASWPKGAAVIGDWLINTAGLEEGSFRLVDGSGLSRYNLITADSSIRLLTFMLRHEARDAFIDSLPVYAVALPQGGDWGGKPLAEFDAERVFAKPGGMSGVNTISGYVDTLDGRRLAFSFLTNGYVGSSAPSRDLRGKVWAELVRYRPASR
ncbi:MAG: D-alanyl-D-alanine carboxypeptidase/D-alanyl-D-alanine-endopeptidase [Planctomycetota bacterium]